MLLFNPFFLSGDLCILLQLLSDSLVHFLTDANDSEESKAWAMKMSSDTDDGLSDAKLEELIMDIFDAKDDEVFMNFESSRRRLGSKDADSTSKKHGAIAKRVALIETFLERIKDALIERFLQAKPFKNYDGKVARLNSDLKFTFKTTDTEIKVEFSTEEIEKIGKLGSGSESIGIGEKVYKTIRKQLEKNAKIAREKERIEQKHLQDKLTDNIIALDAFVQSVLSLWRSLHSSPTAF
jgi:hypothetical protein